MRYLVTTNKEDLPINGQIIMIDGTVPGWQAKPGDLHFDHHRPGGQPVQIMEIPVDLETEKDAIFVTTQADVDACCAAAWIQLQNLAGDGEILRTLIKCAKSSLSAIAYDCDHLGVPVDEPDFMEMADFARNVVAALKQSGGALIEELELPTDRKSWTHDQKRLYASLAFQRGTEWLIDAALAKRDWPGQNGEAAEYWENFDKQRPWVWQRCRMYKNVAILDSRGVNEYVDPRHLIEWARTQQSHENITLTVRDRPLELWSTEDDISLFQEGSKSLGYGSKVNLQAHSYTLGCVPLHQRSSPKLSDRNVWQILSKAENDKRYWIGIPRASTQWGGRNEVGGSSWNDAAILTPEEIIDIVLPLLATEI